MLVSAHYLRDSTGMIADPASDILEFTKAQTLVTGGFRASGAWALQFPVPKSIKFFAVLKGHCWATVDGLPEPVEFGPGDVGLLAAPRAFVLASDLSCTPQDAMEIFSGAGNLWKAQNGRLPRSYPVHRDAAMGNLPKHLLMN